MGPARNDADETKPSTTETSTTDTSGSGATDTSGSGAADTSTEVATETPADEATHATPSPPTETPPGPRGWPIVGNTLQFVRDPWGFYDELATYGDVVGYEIAGMDMVTVLHPDHVERILLTDSEDYRKTQFDEFGVTFADEGLLFSEGEQWRAQRTIVQEAFTPDRIRRYGDSMVAAAQEAVADWPDGETVDLGERYSQLTLSILCRTLFDVEIDEHEQVVTRVAEALNERADSRNLDAFFPSWVPTPRQRRYERALADFDAMVDDLLEDRAAAESATGRTPGNDESEAPTSDGSATPTGDDMLSILSTAEGPDGYVHSDRELRDQLLTFLFAGHDTTSLALTYTSVLLAEHDDVRERLHAEWDDVLGDDDPSVEDVPHLEFTARVLTESLRLYPPAYVLFREAARDTELGGYRIPEGTRLSVPAFRLHDDERFFDDPGTFDPDRWTEAFEATLPDYAYFPFGGGPRHCIGMRFARTELALALPTVLRAVDLDLRSDPDPEISVAATARPASPVRAHVRRRSE